MKVCGKEFECEDCECGEVLNIPDADSLSFGFTLAAPEIGVTVTVVLDPAGFTQDEEAEIADMVARVVNSYVKRRATMLLNPGVYGIAVN